MSDYTVLRYQQQNGKAPFTLWLKGLDNTLKGYVLAKLKKLENGFFSDCSILKDADGVREAKIRTASGLRIYFGIENNEIIILLAGGDKDSQTKNIEKAKEYWQDYKQRRS